MVYITRGLLRAVLEVAADRDPASVTIALAVTAAGDLVGDVDTDLDPDTPVYTDMYLPDTGGSVAAVFGMDLSTPGAAGRFVSHPEGPLALTRRDDLHEVVFVAVTPYDEESVAAFDRSGDEVDYQVIDAEPPEGELADDPR